MSNRPDVPGFLLDGFPANMDQARIFVDTIQAPHKIIFLDVPEQTMFERLKDGMNFDDNDETIKKRIMTFLNTTKPIISSIGSKWPNSVKWVMLVYLFTITLF